MRQPWLILLLAGVFLSALTPPYLSSAGQEVSGRDLPLFDERRSERDRMVDEQIVSRGVRSEAGLEAMRRVPRHLFVPDGQRRHAYRDGPLPIGYGQTISQPYIVACMTEILDLGPGDRVLEIGTGSGYQAAVLAGITPHV